MPDCAKYCLSGFLRAGLVLGSTIQNCVSDVVSYSYGDFLALFLLNSFFGIFLDQLATKFPMSDIK